jgi:hypothetical protein
MRLEHAKNAMETPVKARKRAKKIEQCHRHTLAGFAAAAVFLITAILERLGGINCDQILNCPVENHSWIQR